MAEVDWFAGIFEGEGSFKIVKNKKRTDSHSIAMVVKMTDQDVVERCQIAIGQGRVKGPYNHGTNKPMWYWEVSKGSEIFEVIAKIYHQLGTRRRSRADDMLNLLLRKNPEWADFRLNT